MATLVFDIETSAQPIENFDEAQQEYLFRETEKIGDAIAKEAKREEITRFMSLWPSAPSAPATAESVPITSSRPCSAGVKPNTSCTMRISA